MVSVQVWLQSTDQKRNVMEGHLFSFFFFFNSSRAVTHCLCVQKRNSAARRIWQSHAAKTWPSKCFAATAVLQRWSFSTSKWKEKKKSFCISEQAEGLPSNLRSAAGWPGTSQWMYLVPRPLSTGVFTREDAKQESRAIQSYTSPAEHCVNAIPPVMSQQIMNMTLKL